MQSRELSARLNQAYDVLTNKQARRQYDRMCKQEGVTPSSLRSVEGLTGPTAERAIPIEVRKRALQAHFQSSTSCGKEAVAVRLKVRSVC
jgi:curved DNA-binding protein CbpA